MSDRLTESSRNVDTSNIEISLPSELLKTLNQFVQEPNLRLVILTGSAATNTMREFSDIDIVCLMSQPGFSYPSYQLNYIEETLVSISFATYEDWKSKFTKIDEVRFAKKTILNAKLLFEYEDGLFDILYQRAEKIHPIQFEKLGWELIDEIIIGYLEELHKLANGVHYLNPLDILYGLMGVQHGCWKVLNHYFNCFSDSENDIFENILTELSSIDREDMVSRWRQMWDLDSADISILERGKAGIQFYFDVAELCYTNLSENSKSMIDQAKILIFPIIDAN